MFKKDASKFKKYIESTTAHGVVRIFSGKSVIRRIFWLVIVLAASGGCLYNISDRIRFLISSPTSTATSVTRKSTLTFPAVTVCNLNHFRAEVLQRRNITELIQTALFVVPEATTQDLDPDICDVILRDTSVIPQSVNLSHLAFEELLWEARHILENFIVDCRFAGRRCNVIDMFEPVISNLGICYTFNSGRSGKPLQLARGTGQRQGLQLYINVDQQSYTTPIDAGVKVAIHPQSEPPLPDDQGIGVPPGSNGFISLRELRVIDQTRRDCNAASETSSFSFLQSEYIYDYSIPACTVDCMQTSMANNCGCNSARSFHHPKSNKFAQLPNCTLENICCIVDELVSPSQCNCPPACSSVLYDKEVSYSQFPADFQSIGIASTLNITPSIFRSNLLAISIYFETLNVETQTTSDSYSFVALLSDIGGQLGLFLGVSVISIIEFGAWIIDEIKDRVFGLSEKKLKDVCCTSCKYHSQTKVQVETENELSNNLTYYRIK